VEEITIKRIALVLFFIGMFSLIIILIFQNPESISTSKMPDKDLVKFNATIISVKETSSGLMLRTERSCSQNVFFPTDNASLKEFLSSKQGGSIIILGRSSQNFFTAEKIII
jgi:hypothetical protein